MREQLIEAATRLVSERGQGVGLREIASAAGATPAMIAYYFGDKQGLYEAVFDRVFQRLLARVRELAEAPPAEASPIESFVNIYVRTFQAEPWIPRFLIREVLGDAAFRERFIERFARRIAEVAPALVANEIERGKLRKDLNPELAVVSLVGMLAFPFIAQPIFEPVFGMTLDDAGCKELIEHSARLFLDGARAREGAS